jgi:hypothetical protein
MNLNQLRSELQAPSVEDRQKQSIAISGRVTAYPEVIPGQSHESLLLTNLVPVSIAPEAQWSLAPRFSVGKEARIAFQPRRGDAKGEIVIKISFMRLPWK